MRYSLANLLSSAKARYLVVGGSSFCFEYASFAGLYATAHNLVLANTLSFFVGLIYSFILHRIWSFAGSHRHKAHHQFVGYAILAAINILLSNVVIVVFAKGLHLSPFVAKIVSMIGVVSWNYVLLSKVIFVQRHLPQEP